MIAAMTLGMGVGDGVGPWDSKELWEAQEGDHTIVPVLLCLEG